MLFEISIHAPAWGATKVRHDSGRHTGISIHAPAWGATITKTLMAATKGFQSTLPRGERPSAALPVPDAIAYFNPRSRVGSDFREAA